MLSYSNLLVLFDCPGESGTTLGLLFNQGESVFSLVQQEEFKNDNPLCVAAILHNQISLFLRSRLSFNNKDLAEMFVMFVLIITKFSI